MRDQTTFLRFASISVLLAAAGAFWAGCNQHPADYSTTSSAGTHTQEVAGGETKMDILWVIDNSGSMCEEQSSLRRNFEKFITTLRDDPVDFNMAVTTTHYAPDSPNAVEQVARGGEIQSTPHPPTGFDPACKQPAEIKQQVKAALRCTKPEKSFPDLQNPTDDEIECALDGTKAACKRAGPQWDTNSSVADLFPCGDADGDGKACNSLADFDAVYRDIPAVLEAKPGPDGYENEDGSLKLKKLRRDFGCMSYVGTRGNGKEQGLKAAVRAVSPEKTGGPEGDESAPNHGFIRKDAQTAVIFVTDENDCSIPDDFSFKKNGCGDMNCYFPTMSGSENQDPLLDTGKLADKFMANLAKSKGVDEVDEQDVVIGSIHGRHVRYGSRDKQRSVDSCNRGTYQSLRENAAVCDNPRGSATSGDRYEDFLLNFERIFPSRREGEPHLKGWMCERNFGNALEQLAENLQPESRSCIRNQVVTCTSNAECPDYRWGKSRDGQICQQWGTHPDRKFCRSATQLRLKVDDGVANPLETLRDTGICYKDSIGAEGLSRGCVVKRDAYSWVGCKGADSQYIEHEWDKSKVANPERELSQFTVELEYTVVSQEGEFGPGQSSTK